MLLSIRWGKKRIIHGKIYFPPNEWVNEASNQTTLQPIPEQKRRAESLLLSGSVQAACVWFLTLPFICFMTLDQIPWHLSGLDCEPGKLKVPSS